MLWVDKKYINRVAPRLDKFRWKSDNLASARCPFCGDSKTNPNKCRGYFYTRQEHMSFRCHNCNIGMGIGKFIKTLDPTVYREYLLETFGEGNTRPVISETVSKEIFVDCPRACLPPCALTLPKNHYAAQYLEGRKIPKKFWAEIFFTDDFRDIVKNYAPGYVHSHEGFKDMPPNEHRLVIPFFNAGKDLIGFQGRSLSPTDKKHKYITIKTAEDKPKIWGLHRIDHAKPIYVTEGPFDAMFLDNAVATTDSNLEHVINFFIGKEPSQFVLVYDNEPKNNQIVSRVRRGIARGFNVCIWPTRLSGIKDINDMVLAGYNPSKIQALIDMSSFQGLRAELELTKWLG